MIRRQSCRVFPRFGSRILIFCCVLLMAVLISIAASAQTASQAKLYVVNQNGSHNFSADEVASLSGLQKGANVDKDTIQAAADHLARSGLFSSVRYQFSTADNGLTVTFELQDAPLFPISFDNMPWISVADLTNALNQSGIPFHGTAPASGTFDDQIAQGLQKLLEPKGVRTQVAHTTSATPGSNEEVIEFRATQTNLYLGSIRFTDALALHDPAIQSAASAMNGQPFSIAAIERFNFDKVRPVYLEHSYLKAQFGAPDVQLSGSSTAHVTVPINPGPAYIWSGVTWDGNHAYTNSDLDALVAGTGLAAGQPADGNKIDAIWKRVREAYGHRGYIDATVEPKENFDASAHRASYTVNISEGAQYHMGNLVLTGLSIDAEKRLRAAWKLPQGQIFDQTYCDYFMEKGAVEALRGLPAAQDKIGHFLQKNPDQHTVDVMIDFE